MPEREKKGEKGKQTTDPICLVFAVRLEKANILIELHIISRNDLNPLPEFLQLLLKLLHLLEKRGK